MIARAVDALLELSVIGSFSRIGIRVRRRLERWAPLESFGVAGLTVVATGVTSGIGRATITQLADNGARIVGLARDVQRAASVLDALPAPASGEHVTIACDLSDFADVRRAATDVRASAPSVDRILHVAGVLSPGHATTSAGVEATLATHLLGPYLLTRELEPALAIRARIVWVSSGGMYTQGLKLDELEMSMDGYEGRRAYARAKRAQVVVSELLDNEYGADVAVHAMHPGWVATPGIASGMPLFNRLLGPILRSPGEGADTVLWLAAASAGDTTGAFWHDRRRRRTISLPGTRPSPKARDELLDWIEERIARAEAASARQGSPPT